jgi:single-strand DNA-binding protein
VNVVAFTGRLVSDVAHRNVDGHGAVAEFRIAVDGRNPIYLTVETWGHSAGKAASHLTKGRRIAISGRWAQREFLDRSDQRRQVDYVIAHDITYLDAPRRNGTGVDDTAQSAAQDRAVSNGVGGDGE